ncbi:hypothetical protein ACTD5D_22675 [Nocardia takedensis]|uniref:hypothetical protein n=1 Tax=Nocardia takedensis TaxID=259390 RepID=UPI003F768D65
MIPSRPVGRSNKVTLRMMVGLDGTTKVGSELSDLGYCVTVIHDIGLDRSLSLRRDADDASSSSSPGARTADAPNGTPANAGSESPVTSA